ncbi:MAG: T9SS type A sorting domain-containing protein [Flavobacteriales bacterium]|nr:T9SS type A sorting domain-containing protein [Flavobacteriales bacterium]
MLSSSLKVVVTNISDNINQSIASSIQVSKVLAAALVLVCVSFSSKATVYTSVGTGTSSTPLKWKDSTSWTTRSNAGSNIYIISANDTVDVDVNTAASILVDTVYVYGHLYLNKVINMAPTGIIYVLNGGSVITDASAGKISFGSGASCHIGGGYEVFGPNETVTTINCTSPSHWKYATIPLPVELIRFNATVKQNQFILLEWSTASETNNSHFEVERSLDGQNFEAIGNVQGNGTSSTILNYSYTDLNAFGNSNIAYYRIKQVDYDGNFEYFDAIKIDLSEMNGTLSNQVSMYPNPFTDNVNISIKSDSEYDATLTITNSFGQEVKVINLGYGDNQIQTSDLASGVYYFTLNTGISSNVFTLFKAN